MSKPYIPNDRFARKARELDYRARSVFKLEELDKKYHLLQPNIRVLDLAAAPGSWSQYASKKVMPNGKILALDLQAIEPIADNVISKICDITDTAKVKNYIYELGWDTIDILISDIAPATTGIHEADHGRSIELNMAIVGIAQNFLRKGGYLVMKVFDGTQFNNFIKDLKTKYSFVDVFKAKTSRERSREVYVVCK